MHLGCASAGPRLRIQAGRGRAYFAKRQYGGVAYEEMSPEKLLRMGGIMQKRTELGHDCPKSKSIGSRRETCQKCGSIYSGNVLWQILIPKTHVWC